MDSVSDYRQSPIIRYGIHHALVGMLIRSLEYEKSAIAVRLRRFGLDLKANPASLGRSSKLFFLCGANITQGVPSKRRNEIKSFVEHLSHEYRIIFAEGVFDELKSLGYKKNILDLEHVISEIADKIIIVLESESAFCELGAFSHSKLRNKLIIINDLKFKNSRSFIMLGPIAAAEEVKSPVLWYSMTDDGIRILDGVGAIFHDLKAAINKGGIRPLSPLLDVSNLSANKESLYFAHDLVLFFGPITHGELIAVLTSISGKQSYDILKKLLGVLCAAGLIRKVDDLSKKPYYKTESTEAFLRYHVDTKVLMASFRYFHLKTNPQRFFSA